MQLPAVIFSVILPFLDLSDLEQIRKISPKLRSLVHLYGRPFYSHTKIRTTEDLLIAKSKYKNLTFETRLGHHYIRTREKKKLENLLKLGLNPNQCCQINEGTLMIQAVKSADHEIIRMLHHYGADVNLFCFLCGSLGPYPGFSPLGLSCCRDDIKTTRLLLSLEAKFCFLPYQKNTAYFREDIKTLQNEKWCAEELIYYSINLVGDLKPEILKLMLSTANQRYVDDIRETFLDFPRGGGSKLSQDQLVALHLQIDECDFKETKLEKTHSNHLRN